jgi:ribonuclease HI
MGGAGGILHFSNNHFLSFSTGLGEATNNYSELMALYLVLLLALEKNIRKLNIYGDSMFAIQVMKDTHILISYTLLPLLEEIKRCSAYFTHSLLHMYTEIITKKQTSSPKLAWTWIKDTGRSKKKARIAPRNIFTTLGSLSY